MSGSGDERQDGALHRAQRRLVDVDVIDLGGIGGGDRPGDRVRDECASKSRSRSAAGTSFESQTPGMWRSGCSTTAAATTGPGQTAAPDFVDAGDVHEPDAAQRVLERARRGHASHWNLRIRVQALRLSFSFV